jgi:hypothetical protein
MVAGSVEEPTVMSTNGYEVNGIEEFETGNSRRIPSHLT